MSQLNDENTRLLVNAGAERILALLSHFQGSDQSHFRHMETEDLVMLGLFLDTLGRCVHNEVEERTHVVTDTGT